jgi:predicted GNAT family acetyltransferase
MDVTVADVAEHHRFEARTADGTLAGLAAYQLNGGAITFTHTETEPAFEGQGVAAQLVRFALRDARRRGLQIVPVCPYVAAYLKRHPDVFDGIDPGDAAR